MTSRRIIKFAVYASLFIAALLILFFVIAPLPAHAQNLRIDDEVYVPAAAHAVTPWFTSLTDIWITNETGDPVKVTATYRPMNAPPIPTAQSFTLAPHERREICDFLGPARTPTATDQCKAIGLMGIDGFGYVIFDGCLDGVDCAGHTGQPSPATANYRAISVESRTYTTSVAGGPLGPSVGQDIPGIPWWSFGDPLNPAEITGIRASDVFHTNLVIINASPYSSATYTLSLYDGGSVGLRDQAQITLQPLEARNAGVTALFQKLAEWLKANPTRSATNAFVKITQSGVVLTPDAVAVGCPDGCPGFFAIGSLIDGRTGDATTLEATLTRPLTSAQIVSLFGPASAQVATPKMPPPGALSERAQATALANMTIGVMHGLAVKAATASAQSATVKASAVPLHKRMEKE